MKRHSYDALPKRGRIWTRNKWKTARNGARGKLGSMLGEGRAFREKAEKTCQGQVGKRLASGGREPGGSYSGPGERSPAWPCHVDRTETVALSSGCTREWLWELKKCGWDDRARVLA